MPMSPYYRSLREKVGRDLLMMPGVAAVIHDQSGNILVQERVEGGHSLPAGAIEPGEHPAQAVVRETFEETGLLVRPTALLGVFGGSDGFRTVYPNDDVVEYLVCLFRCQIVGGALSRFDGESAALRFYDPDSMPRLGMEYPRQLLRRGCEGGAFDWDERWIHALSPLV